MATAWTIAQVHAAHGINKGFREIDPTKKPGRGELVVKSIKLDFDNIATGAGVSLAANDTIDCIPVRAGEVVIYAGVNNITDTTAGCTYDLGIGTGASPVLDWFLDGGTDNVAVPTNTNGYQQGSWYRTTVTSADYLNLKILGNSGAAGVVVVWALVWRLIDEQAHSFEHSYTA
jgi:hypothetical protein